MNNNEQERVRKALGEKLHHAREVAKLTQQEVADAAGVHVNYYARIERGQENPSFEKLQAIMKTLGIKSIDLI